jgi:hypothetical protein
VLFRSARIAKFLSVRLKANCARIVPEAKLGLSLLVYLLKCIILPREAISRLVAIDLEAFCQYIAIF